MDYPAQLPGAARTPRNPLAVSLAVWNALFLREAVARLSATRGAWLFLVLEPMLHAGVMVFIFSVLRARSVAGADVTVWLALGLTGFFTARNVFQRSMKAIDANQALFAYRQVRPIDTVIVRAMLETLLGFIVMMGLLGALAFLGHSVLPHAPMESIFSFTGLVLCGFGIGLIISVLGELIPEAGDIIAFLFWPLYFLSGVIIPLSIIPVQYREWLFYNPFAHGLELLRGSFFPVYHAAPEANFGYLYGFALASIFLGLALHARFAQKLRAK